MKKIEHAAYGKILRKGRLFISGISFYLSLSVV